MKIKHLLIGLFAVAAAVACKQDEPVATPKLDVDKTAVQVAATAGEASFSVTTNQDWTVTPDADWVSVDPATGKGSEKAVTVKVTAEDNTSEEPRTAKITVKAGELTKTVSVTQAGGQGEEPGPGPEPGPDADTYILVGEAVGGWDVDANGVVLTLTDGYYVAKEVGITAQKGMHFTKNSSWEGNVKGLHGLIAPNEIGEVGSNDISLTEGGAFDVYLTEALDKFYFMTPGKTPSEAVEHVELAVSWGICGALEGNSWGASADVVLEAEGEWLVAKGVNFTDVNFKIRGNNSWAADVKWGRASKDQPNGNLHEAIAVSTCSEYNANGNEGDNPNIYVGAAAGKYDVYFSPEKKEVWVMLEGYKPGDALPEMEKTWGVIGVNGDWSSDVEMTLEGDYYVAKNVKYNDDAAVEFKIRANKAWVDDTNMGLDKDVPWGAVNTAIPVVNATTAKANGADDAGNIGLADVTGGTYDIYFDLAGLKVWIMTPGLKPGEKEPVVPEPEPEYTLDGKQWLFSTYYILIDLGLYQEDAMVIALPAEDGSGFKCHKYGTYEIVKTDATSGKILFSEFVPSTKEFLDPVEFPYSDLSEGAVLVNAEELLDDPTPMPFTVVPEPYEILFDNLGGEEPSGPIENGEYWFIETGAKVSMKPLSGNFGYPEAGYVLAENGTYASTAENAFTFTYLPDYSYYTIQDSNGKYLYMKTKNDGSWYTSFNVGEYVEGDSHYHWCVEVLSDGTYDIYNEESGYQIAYSSTYGSWGAYATGSGNALPLLVKADNPVEEPAAPSGSVTLSLGTSHQDWVATTHDTYGEGYVATVDGLKIEFYKNESNTAPSQGLQSDHIRVYQGSNLMITSTEGKKIKSVDITCTGGKTGPVTIDNTQYSAAGTVISWAGELDVFDAYCDKQVRVSKLAVVVE